MIDKSILLDNKQFTVGTFDDSDKLLHAVDTLRAKGVKIFDCFTPFPVHHLDQKLGYSRSNLTVGAFICGLLGALSGWTLAFSMNVVDWPMIVGGKPTDVTLFTSFVPIIFELTILFTAFGMVIMFFARSRMMHGIKEDLLDRRQTNDLMLLAIDNNEDQVISNSEIQTILHGEGAINVKGEAIPFNTSLTSEEDLEAFFAGSPIATSEVAAQIVEEEAVVAEPEPIVESAPVAEEKNDEANLAIIKATLGDASGAKDDLKKISGIGPVYEKTLNGIGIYTFEQVSKMNSETIKAVEEITNYFPGRIERDDWISQANTLKNK